MTKYLASYSDRAGEVRTLLDIEVNSLRTELRGVPFVGCDFDDLCPERPLSAEESRQFDFARESLCSCRFSWAMPVAVVADGRDSSAELLIEVELGDARADGGLSREDVSLSLRWSERDYRSQKASWFEDAFEHLQRLLPKGAKLKVCFSCAYSDYSPGGHGLWGGLACFRDQKAAYTAVRSKQDLFRIWDLRTEFVAETYLCPEFQIRVAGTGYRG